MTPDPETLDRLRTRIATTVHDAVCAFSQSDGFGLCQLYTIAGYCLLSRLDGPQWIMQAGSAWISADPPNGWCYFDAGSPHAIQRGEFHCWLAKQGATKDGPPAAFVDLTARHFRRMVEQMTLIGGPLPWTHATEPPPFIWTEGTQSAWVRWEPLPDACRMLWTFTLAHIEQYRLLMCLLQDRYRALMGAGEAIFP